MEVIFHEGVVRAWLINDSLCLLNIRCGLTDNYIIRCLQETQIIPNYWNVVDDGLSILNSIGRHDSITNKKQPTLRSALVPGNERERAGSSVYLSMGDCNHRSGGVNSHCRNCSTTILNPIQCRLWG